MAQNYGCLSFISVKCKKCFPFFSAKAPRDTDSTAYRKISPNKRLKKVSTKQHDVRFSSPSPKMTPSDLQQRKTSSNSEIRKKSSSASVRSYNGSETTKKKRKESTSVSRKVNAVIDWEMHCKPKFHATTSVTQSGQQSPSTSRKLNQQRWQRSLKVVTEQQKKWTKINYFCEQKNSNLLQNMGGTLKSFILVAFHISMLFTLMSHYWNWNNELRDFFLLINQIQRCLIYSTDCIVSAIK
jgi:hypothetical protein